MKLRIGLGPGGKVLTVVMGVAISTMALVLTGHAVDVPVLAQLPIDDIPADFGIWNKVIAAAVLLGCATGVLHAFRYGVRLDGTTVAVRGIFTTSRVNLAAAHQFWFSEKKEHANEIRGGYEVHTTYFTPLLCVRDRHGTARIPLSYYGRPMRKSDYRALAMAIFKGQRQRTPESAAQAYQAIRALGGQLPAQHAWGGLP